MADLRLTARLPLDDYRRQFEGVLLAEASGLAIVSIATPLDAHETLQAAIRAAYGTSLPDIGNSQCSQDGRATFLALQRDLAFLVFDYSGDVALHVVAEKLGDVAYYSDQSDSWAVLKASGPGVRAALQRVCMLDLAPSAFPVGAVKRTTMEHLGAIVYRESADSMLLMSPRSSGESFLHAMETAVLDSAG